ncbi:MAG: hypothetical protein AUG44_08685 [Actinobacteria bacterium 13_1_20CM_3_71_11]|nr:MAG: hypothetical protein AUG44_08685 [Actinobacteria bacterium 13_1_20CM_3_71_11]
MTTITIPSHLHRQVATERLYGRHSSTRNLDHPTLPFPLLYRREAQQAVPNSHGRHRQHDPDDLTTEDLMAGESGFKVQIRGHGPRRLYRKRGELYFLAALTAAAVLLCYVTVQGWTPW